MGIFYKSYRIGKNGKPFFMYKIRTLKEGVDRSSSYAKDGQYAWCGRFLRKHKADELPQFFNVLKGDISLVGPRAEEEKSLAVLPEDISEKLLSVKPGITSLSSIYFFDEESFLRKVPNSAEVYWTKIKPIKLILDMFYIENKSFSLDCWILYATFKRVIKEIFK